MCDWPESTSETMAGEEDSEHLNSRSRSCLHPRCSFSPQRSLKSHSGPLVARLQRAGRRCHCFGWCDKVIMWMLYNISEQCYWLLSALLTWCRISFHQADRIWAFHGWLAFGEGDEAPSVTSRVGGWIFQVPAVSWIQNVSLHIWRTCLGGPKYCD